RDGSVDVDLRRVAFRMPEKLRNLISRISFAHRRSARSVGGQAHGSPDRSLPGLTAYSYEASYLKRPGPLQEYCLGWPWNMGTTRECDRRPSAQSLARR